jgi:hypothetical protein
VTWWSPAGPEPAADQFGWPAGRLPEERHRGLERRPDAAPAAGAPKPLPDRRFAGQEWLQNPAAAYTAQMYLLNARTLMQMAESVQGDEKTKARIRFAVQQWVDATSPSNFLAFNPEALQKALDTKGESIAAGHAAAARRTCSKGHVSQTDERCSRSAATWPPPKAAWCSRTSCSS